MRSRRLLSLVFLLLALACCTRSPADQLKTELQTVTSWTATARMAAEAWLKGSVPRAYTAQTLLAAEETLHEEARTIQAQQASEPQASLLARAQSAGQVIGQMRAAVEGDDRQALAQLLKQLEAEEQAVKSLAGGARP